MRMLLCLLQDGWTCLHEAAYYGDYSLASALLSWGTEVDAVTVSYCIAGSDIKANFWNLIMPILFTLICFNFFEITSFIPI